MDQLTIKRGRTIVVPVSLGFDISADTFTSEIRVGRDISTALIATWSVTFATDGTDGELLLSLDDAVTALISYSIGYMDIKRVTGGEPVSVFDDPIQVAFEGVVTA